MCLALTKLNVTLHFYHICHSSLSLVIAVFWRDCLCAGVTTRKNTYLREASWDFSIRFQVSLWPILLCRPQRCWVCVLHLYVLWKVGVVWLRVGMFAGFMVLYLCRTDQTFSSSSFRGVLVDYTQTHWVRSVRVYDSCVDWTQPSNAKLCQLLP